MRTPVSKESNETSLDRGLQRQQLRRRYLGLVVRYDGDASFDAAGNVKRAKDRSRCQLAWSPDSKRWFPLRDARKGADLVPLGKKGSVDAYDCYPSRSPRVFSGARRKKPASTHL